MLREAKLPDPSDLNATLTLLLAQGHGRHEEMLEQADRLRAELEAPADPAPSSPTSDTTRAPRSPGMCPNQATWLQRHIAHPNVGTARRLETLGGPEHHVIPRLLQGYGTDRDDVLHKLVQGLNEAHASNPAWRTLTIADIPRD